MVISGYVHACDAGLLRWKASRLAGALQELVVASARVVEETTALRSHVT